jgi:Leucine-rich repeat (LRR) protein
MLKCNFYTENNFYVCEIKSQEIPLEVNSETFEGDHEENRCNDDVQHLDIWDSKITKIPCGLGEVFKNVTRLWIGFSNLREISKEDLKEFQNLTSFIVYKNQLEEIPKDLFEFNTKLKIILLRFNKIQRIESGLLDELQDLENFDVGHNEIELVPGDFFKFNKKLKKFSFKCNKIKFVGPELLDGLSDLTYVDFEGNPSVNISDYEIMKRI